MLLVLFGLLVLAILAPVVLLQFGPESTATSIKLVLNAVAGYSVETPPESELEQRLAVPEGFVVSLYDGDLEKVRFIKFSAGGDLLATRPRKGDVLLLARDANQDRLPDGRRTLLSGLTRPQGLALWNGWLYIAESNAIGRVRFDEQSGVLQGEYQHVVEGLADKGNHWSKTLAFGPDGWMYLSSGSTCNVCEEDDPQRATILRYQPDGSKGEIYATGLRNSVGMDWAPWDQQLYATDNGRDLLGDDFPPCELNRIEQGGFYGWPYINGFAQLDPDLGAGKEALLATAISPVFGFKAHNAPLGIHFIRQAKMPAGFNKAALVALHGSWNRSERDGYKVVSLHWQDDGSIVEKDFLTGFLNGDTVIGRPVDVTEGPDGAIYITDDYSGAIYRVAYAEEAPALHRAKLASKRQADNQAALRQAYSESQVSALQQQGEALYQQYQCANCHEQNRMRAGAKAISLAQLSARYSISELAEFFITPTPPMPLYPLSAQQREALAVYLYKQ